MSMASNRSFQSAAELPNNDPNDRAAVNHHTDPPRAEALSLTCSFELEDLK